MLAIVVMVIAYFSYGWLRDTILPRAQSVVPEYALYSRATLEERLKDSESNRLLTQYQALLYTHTMQKVEELERALALRPLETYVSARVIARPPHTHFDSLIIDQGSNAGVVAGDSVTAFGVMVGSVSSVSSGTAVVQLTSSPGATRDFELGEPRAVVVAEGKGGGSFEALVPRDVALSIGDVVTDIESGYPVAVVRGIASSTNDVTNTLYLSLPVALVDISVVSLVHKPSP
jgi:cell shape-determining protein MreC